MAATPWPPPPLENIRNATDLRRLAGTLSPAWDIKCEQLNPQEWMRLAYGITEDSRMHDDAPTFPFVFANSSFLVSTKHFQGVASDCVYALRELTGAVLIQQLWDECRGQKFGNKDVTQRLASIRRILMLVSKNSTVPTDLKPIQLLPPFDTLCDVLLRLSVYQRLVRPFAECTFAQSLATLKHLSGVWTDLPHLVLPKTWGQKYVRQLVTFVKGEFAAATMRHHRLFRQPLEPALPCPTQITDDDDIPCASVANAAKEIVECSAYTNAPGRSVVVAWAKDTLVLSLYGTDARSSSGPVAVALASGQPIDLSHWQTPTEAQVPSFIMGDVSLERVAGAGPTPFPSAAT